MDDKKFNNSINNETNHCISKDCPQGQQGDDGDQGDQGENGEDAIFT